MAQFRVEGIETVIKAMHRMGNATGPVADEMLSAAAEIVVGAWQASIQSHGHIDTGAMFRSVKPTPAKTQGDTRVLSVYPQGSDKRGIRNAEKAFIANFGRTHQRGTGFVQEAEKNAEGPAQEAMINIWDAFIGQ